ncbi:MAG: N-acetylneuraminate synthase family protein [Zoogloeaceae bacterium]|jgi:N-acetylneuraminate synthase|nr:N-acetylneuraminate synthase family protein [Zoogloeaceae bacterium]
MDARPAFYIDRFPVGDERVFVIAEIGNNHNGSLELAKRLVDSAQEAGADCVKFQLRNRTALYRPRGDGQSEDLGVEYLQDLLARMELSLDEHRELHAYVVKKGLPYLATPWDAPSVDVLASFNVPAFKIASADLTNPALIAKAASFGKPLILSTGMSFEHEIIRAIAPLQASGLPFALLHCNSAYPAPESDIQLRYLARLRELHPIVGYSGHERGIAISLAAVALGTQIIERHITLDRGMEGPDHLASLEAKEFKALVDGIRQLERALPWHPLADGTGRKVSQGELLNRENLGKSVVAARPIARGEVFSRPMLAAQSPGQGLPPYRLEELIGKTAKRDLQTGDFLFASDLDAPPPETPETQKAPEEKKRHFAFPVRWGVPVRYHDFLRYRQWITPDLFEFHLSYRDLSLDPRPFLAQTDASRLVIHAPELFENSELLDLASDDLAYRQRSIDNLQRVVTITLAVAEFFPRARDLLIVANVGGFSADAPAPLERRAELYRRFYESCAQIRFGRTELIPQNMTPFPWHFGGQRHQNIFMMPAELAREAQARKLRLCLDLSHLSMTCFHFGLDFQVSLKTLLPHTAHLHIADALGDNGEGVPIGSGDIDWRQTWAQIRARPEISFIPEIWQGHKDHGAGFWSALEFLTQIERDIGQENMQCQENTKPC